MTPADRRMAVRRLQEQFAVSERRAVHYWACEEVLALVGHHQRMIVEANAEKTTASGGSVIRCP